MERSWWKSPSLRQVLGSVALPSGAYRWLVGHDEDPLQNSTVVDYEDGIWASGRTLVITKGRHAHLFHICHGKGSPFPVRTPEQSLRPAVSASSKIYGNMSHENPGERTGRWGPSLCIWGALL